MQKIRTSTKSPKTTTSHVVENYMTGVTGDNRGVYLTKLEKYSHNLIKIYYIRLHY